MLKYNHCCTTLTLNYVYYEEGDINMIICKLYRTLLYIASWLSLSIILQKKLEILSQQVSVDRNYKKADHTKMEVTGVSCPNIMVELKILKEHINERQKCNTKLLCKMNTYLAEDK